MPLLVQWMHHGEFLREFDQVALSIYHYCYHVDTDLHLKLGALSG